MSVSLVLVSRTSPWVISLLTSHPVREPLKWERASLILFSTCKFPIF